MTPYRSAVLAELRHARFANEDHNYDSDLGPEPPPGPGVLRETLTTAWKQLRDPAAPRGAAAESLRQAFQYALSPNAYFSATARAALERGDYLYPRLADQRSRDLLVKLIAFSILGYRRVKLPRNTPEYWATLENVGQYATAEPPVKIAFRDLDLPLFDARPLGFDMQLHSTGVGIAYALCQKQYEYDHGGVRCRVEAGDVVIDAGGCWGDTTLYFAHEVGPSGVCVVYDFIPSNIKVLKHNLARNPQLAERVRLVERPIWSTSGKDLYYVDWGPGSRVSDDPARYANPEGKATTITIDETLARLGLDRLDFIKMDIEGAELDALKGAEASIRKHRPKLAISLYHRPEDFTEIPRYIDSLRLGYTFYLEHHTLYQNETVLFCVPKPSAIDVAYTLHTQGRTAEAEIHYKTLVVTESQTPDGMSARNNLLAILRDQGRLDEADDLIRDALEVAPGDPQWSLRLATSLLQKGDFAAAWPLYEQRIPLSRDWPMLSRLPSPQWGGGKIKSLLVWPEQDFGDVILFSRYLPMLRDYGISVTLACPPALVSLLAPLVDEVIPVAGTMNLPTRDAWVMLGSLPGLFQTTVESIPPPPVFSEDLAQARMAGAGLGVAVGRAKQTPPAGSPGEAARRLVDQLGAVNLDLALQGSDFASAARVLAGLGQVVGTNTPIAHLSATLGLPTWVLLPRNNTDWRWGRGGTGSPWYPSVTVVRESATGQWEGLPQAAVMV